MALEYEIRGDKLLWIKNPVTGVISYVVDLRGKSFAFTLSGREHHPPEAGALNEAAIRHAIATCPFCPGNENQTTPEIFRLTRDEMPHWTGAVAERGSGWIIRVINNLFPRIPAQLTGDRNESYVVVEDPRHFVEAPRSHYDLAYTGVLGEEHFVKLIATDARVMLHAFQNREVKAIAVRKNQGRESGASQPHVHQQIIGSPRPLPAVEQEVSAARETPGVFNEMIELFDRLELIIENQHGVVTYASPIGLFPRSYDVVMPKHLGLLTDLDEHELKAFARALYRILRVLGPLPLDYEIHQGEGLPLHAHINARLYPYSNVAGTLNVPNTLLHSAIALRKALSSAD
jgi:UDPglucose--hexose-1-phosphate uridylyltransferase